MVWRRIKNSIGFLLLFGGLACGQTEHPDAVARRFVDAYYVDFDFAQARRLSKGHALARLDAEEDLVRATRSQGHFDAARSRVSYSSPVLRRLSDTMRYYVFDLAIRANEITLRRQAVVMMGKRKSGWKVLKFREESSFEKVSLQ